MGKLHKAKRAKQDEFYTQIEDIERELEHYEEHFRGKNVYCNCDDPTQSHFWQYFSLQFERLGLKKLMATCYKSRRYDLFSDHTAERSFYLEYNGERGKDNAPDPEEIEVRYLDGDGDFRSAECVELLKEADIVVTNPPFSLFREYVAQLVKYEKKFLIVAPKNAVTYKDVFPLILGGKVWVGYTPMGRDMLFRVPEHVAEALVAAGAEGSAYRVIGENVMARSESTWLTNLDHSKRHEKLYLSEEYSVEEYPKYDNIDAIEIGKVVNIPKDYGGVMGVPISFLDKHNPEQFAIIGLAGRHMPEALRTRLYSNKHKKRHGHVMFPHVSKPSQAMLLSTFACYLGE